MTELVTDLQREISKLTTRGAEKVVLGCSELSMFSEYLEGNMIIDPIALPSGQYSIHREVM